MEAGLIAVNTLPEEKLEEVLRAQLHPEGGVGYTAMRPLWAERIFILRALGLVLEQLKTSGPMTRSAALGNAISILRR